MWCAVQVVLQDAADEVVLTRQQDVHALLLLCKGVVGALRQADTHQEEHTARQTLVSKHKAHSSKNMYKMKSSSTN